MPADNTFDGDTGICNSRLAASYVRRTDNQGANVTYFPLPPDRGWQNEMGLDTVEGWVGWIGAAAGLVTLGVALWGLGRGLRRPRGRATGRAPQVLRTSVYLVVSLTWFSLCLVLWRPLPLSRSLPALQ